MAIATRRLLIGALLAVLAAVTTAGSAGAARKAGTSVIHACYNKRTKGYRTYGNFRMLRPGQTCGPTENSITWSVSGPQGVHGATGPNGVQGNAGIAGATGGIGPTGPGGEAGR